MWLDEWRTRWEHEHTEAEMDEAADGDSSYGGHPYWTEPTDHQLDLYADAALDALRRAPVDERMEAMAMESVDLVRPCGDGRAGGEVLTFWRPRG